ncbi:unnamed protein product [Adineta steineri]|uniref:Nuclear receptor domain-containing protein n=1 Tax=Adineta steineri TaxID=433720 RepID=A0A813WM40_9BILA|nr:unnamed protein product [Adineta steineri]CAF3847273.1 unnamed protein product [Adineta steineri]
MTSRQPFVISSEIHYNKSLSKTNFCKVCGDEARINNYGALSCHSCKTFFRRNGFRPETVRPCQDNGRCHVNKVTRKLCTACRLCKCFAVGMHSDFIRKPDYRIRKNSSSIKYEKTEFSNHAAIRSVSQLPTLDLLNHDRSSLTTSQWTLFSNVLHAHDRFSLMSTLHHILNSLSSSYQGARFNEANAVETIGAMYISMESFISCTPDFQVLSVNEQQSLLKRNLHCIGSSCSNFLFRDAHFLNNPDCFQIYRRAYGSEMTNQAYHLTKQLDLDSTLIKFMLIIVAFSSNSFLVDIDENIHNDSLLLGTFRLFGSQNVYVELLWKYMEYRYGYSETVIRFAGLVKHVLSMIKHAANIYISNEIHHDFVAEVVEKTNETLIKNQNELVPLWGKPLSAS